MDSVSGNNTSRLRQSRCNNAHLLGIASTREYESNDTSDRLRPGDSYIKTISHQSSRFFREYSLIAIKLP